MLFHNPITPETYKILTPADGRHNERPIQTITLVLQAFKDRGGFNTINQILSSLASEMQSSNSETVHISIAVLGMRQILSLYGQLVFGKNVTEAIQTLSMTSREREGRGILRPESFNPGQFVVELRMAILPSIRKLWESGLCEKASSDISEKIIEVIRIIAAADW
jgi:E3 ubiquitin-protein ligase HUWE1